MKYNNPFPGMNPYLERGDIWPGFHNRLIAVLAEELGPRLPDNYRLELEQRVEVETPLGPPSALAFMIPDALVTTEPVARLPGVPSVATTGATAVTGPPPEQAASVRVLMPREVNVSWLSIKTMPESEVVTIVEVLSLTNKAPGTGRLQYLNKRETISASYVNLVEIDLLRRWDPMPLETPQPASDYRILVCRALEHPSALLYPFSVKQTIPKFPLPLLPEDEELEVDLGAIINAMHHTARYGQIARYNEPPPEPAFEADTQEWVAERVVDLR